MPNELKPCPFCGGKRIGMSQRQAYNGSVDVTIYCSEGVRCSASVRTVSLPTAKEAVEAAVKMWNRRANDEQR